MANNDQPLGYRNIYLPETIMDIVERTNTRIFLRARAEALHAVSSIGALVSADRSIVYWINETRPLPRAQ